MVGPGVAGAIFAFISIDTPRIEGEHHKAASLPAQKELPHPSGGDRIEWKGSYAWEPSAQSAFAVISTPVFRALVRARTRYLELCARKRCTSGRLPSDIALFFMSGTWKHLTGTCWRSARLG